MKDNKGVVCKVFSYTATIAAAKANDSIRFVRAVAWREKNHNEMDDKEEFKKMDSEFRSKSFVQSRSGGIVLEEPSPEVEQSPLINNMNDMASKYYSYDPNAEQEIQKTGGDPVRFSTEHFEFEKSALAMQTPVKQFGIDEDREIREKNEAKPSIPGENTPGQEDP